MHDLSLLSLSPKYMSKKFFLLFFFYRTKIFQLKEYSLFDEAAGKWYIDCDLFNGDSSLTT